jgi:hypothetical protein
MLGNLESWAGHEFRAPNKAIVLETDVDTWKGSSTCQQFIGFLGDLQLAVKSKPISSTPPKPHLQPVREFIAGLARLLDEIPPIEQPMRYGNKAFRDWH